jgi:hypothetical protein
VQVADRVRPGERGIGRSVPSADVTPAAMDFELLFSIGAVIVVVVLLVLEARRARRHTDD